MKREQTAKAAAEMLGCDEKTLRRHCNASPASERAPHTRLPNGQIRVDAGELAAWGRERNINFRPGRPTENPESPDLEAVRIRKEAAMAENWEHRNAVIRRDFLPAEEVKQVFMEEVNRAKGRFAGLAADVAGACEGLDAGDIQVLLEGRINQILSDLASGLN